MKEESDAPSGVMTREQRGLDQILGVKYFGQRKPEKSAIIERAAWEPGLVGTGFQRWKSTTKRYKSFSFPPIGGHFEAAAQIPVDFVSISVFIKFTTPPLRYACFSWLQQCCWFGPVWLSPVSLFGDLTIKRHRH